MGPRPLGVTILAVLNAIEGLWGLWIGSMFLGLGIAALFTLDENAIGGYAAVYGILVIAVGLVLLVVAAGYYGLESWAWLYGVLINGLNLVLGVLSGVFAGHWAPFVGVLLPLVILLYLFRPDVKAVFGR